MQINNFMIFKNACIYDNMTRAFLISGGACRRIKEAEEL
jgi:hypothetical protein